jgi:hypothetical protein
MQTMELEVTNEDGGGGCPLVEGDGLAAASPSPAVPSALDSQHGSGSDSNSAQGGHSNESGRGWHLCRFDLNVEAWSTLQRSFLAWREICPQDSQTSSISDSQFGSGTDSGSDHEDTDYADQTRPVGPRSPAGVCGRPEDVFDWQVSGSISEFSAPEGAVGT